MVGTYVDNAKTNSHGNYNCTGLGRKWMFGNRLRTKYELYKVMTLASKHFTWRRVRFLAGHV